MPFYLKEIFFVERVSRYTHGIVIVALFSKHANPIFAQREPSRKLRVLVGLQKISSLVADNYNNKSHPVSTSPNAAQHLVGKFLFCKLDCSQVYHCLQMADQRSKQMLAFNFVGRILAYRRLAQGLNRFVFAFYSIKREYLDPIVKAYQCAQNVDEIGIAATISTYLTRNIRAIFKCICQTGVKLTTEICQFWVTQDGIFGKTITSGGISSKP